MKIVLSVLAIVVVAFSVLFAFTYAKGTNPFIPQPTPIPSIVPSPTPQQLKITIEPAITPSAKVAPQVSALYKNMILTVPETSYKITIPALNTPVSYEQGNDRGNVIVTGPVDFIEKTGTYAATLNVNNGGSGTFAHVILFQKTENSMNEIDSAPIGDRVPVESITIDDSKKEVLIEVEYLERRPDEPMVAEPTVKQTKTFTLEDGKLVIQ